LLQQTPGHTPNNRMELTAAREAIKRVPTAAALEIITDSQVVVGWLAKGWKRNNPGTAALCQAIDGLRAARAAAGGRAVAFRHVRGHNGDPLNERADALATGAIRARVAKQSAWSPMRIGESVDQGRVGGRRGPG
jgi:ribonuclease HI